MGSIASPKCNLTHCTTTTVEIRIWITYERVRPRLFLSTTYGVHRFNNTFQWCSGIYTYNIYALGSNGKCWCVELNRQGSLLGAEGEGCSRLATWRRLQLQINTAKQHRRHNPISWPASLSTFFFKNKLLSAINLIVRYIDNEIN